MVFPSHGPDHIATCLVRVSNSRDWTPRVSDEVQTHMLGIQDLTTCFYNLPTTAQNISISPFLGSWHLSAWCPSPQKLAQMFALSLKIHPPPAPFPCRNHCSTLAVPRHLTQSSIIAQPAVLVSCVHMRFTVVLWVPVGQRLSPPWTPAFPSALHTVGQTICF